MSLYKQFIEESKPSTSVLEGDDFFITLQAEDTTLVILGAYVARSSRSYKRLTELGKLIEVEARKRECSDIVVIMDPQDRDTTSKVRAYFRWGMEIFHSDEKGVYLIKRLK